MSNEKERRCLTCKKLLLDETMPICLRCKLQGRDYAGKGGKIIIGGLAITFFGSKVAIDNTKK